MVQFVVIFLRLGLCRSNSNSLLVGSHVEYFSPMPKQIKQSFRKFFSKRIKNSVQVKTFNVLSIRLDTIYAQVKDTDCFLSLLKKYGLKRYHPIFEQRRTNIRKQRYFFTYREQLGQ